MLAPLSPPLEHSYAANAPASNRRTPDVSLETLLGCKAGNEAAYARFVRHYQGCVMAVLYRMMGALPETEDLAQEVFLRAFRALPRFDENGSATVTTWLLTIATRLALNGMRRMRTGPVLSSDPDSETDGVDPSTPESRGASAELARAIESAAAALPIDQRAAFVLAEFHDMTMAEIAVALDVPENTAKTRVFRAREKMRVLLAPHWREP